MKLGVLTSGNLGLIVLKHLSFTKDIVFVLTDKRSEEIINFCRNKGLFLFVGNPRNRRAFGFIEDKEIDILISINYLFLIEEDIINLPKKMAFNIHGSILPKYRGRTPHVWAIINNENETGITAHLIDSGCDTGDIIEQRIIPIETSDTGANLLNKFNELYIPVVDSVLDKISKNKIILRVQDESKATYFGKRSPEDGKINWNWQKERIRNWVRAQCHPYPGAFSYYKSEKIVIDEVEICEYGFNYKMKNGQVLCLTPLVIKTPNGAIILKKIRNKNQIDFQLGEVIK